MDGIIYLTLDQAKAIHAKTIQYSGGGTTEPLDTGKLESVLAHIQNDDYYPTFIDIPTLQTVPCSVQNSVN